MKRYQLNLLSVAIILVIISLAFIIYYQYSMNVKEQQENLIFENFINNLQNLENTINSIQGTYYIKVNIPNGIILYANGPKLIIQYNNNNYTIDFQNKTVVLYNNNQNVNFLYPNNHIYIVSTNNTIFVTTNLQNSITILNEYLSNGNLVYINPENINNNNEGNNQGNNNNNINQNVQCLFQYNGQANFFWGDVNGNNYLPPIGDQGECGDCWAFASANGIASIYMIRNNQPNDGLQLSPAYLAIECNNGYPNTPNYCNSNEGCTGGVVYPALLFTSQYGIPPDQGWNYYNSTLANCLENNNQNYPGDVCNYNYNGPNSPLYYSQGVIFLTQNGPLTDQQVIQDLLCYGPLVAAGFLGGSGGSNPNINPQQPILNTGHAMLLVGYTTSNTIYSQLCQEVYETPNCWIFENQWGDNSACIVLTTSGVPVPGPNNPNQCGELYQNYQDCNNYLQLVLKVPGVSCGGVYWMQDGYLLVPFDQSSYGQTFPYYIVAIQNVTLAQ
ncbi:Peptidase C1A subfamily [Candidatus Nanobsidianus stetteri]|uniref:Peptidase C1A subfamily n=1 Tax=Nanobsidianus stetteri TaxID=1294122 RepID=R1G2C5_NANST|nr:Peptidase C1A subfamily [Candidatus Nanobsidianus stetteri]